MKEKIAWYMLKEGHVGESRTPIFHLRSPLSHR